MWKRILLLATLGSAALAPARDKPENWVQVRSPHFLIVTDSNEKQARRIADQFERMRSVFQQLFPKLHIDPATPIIVLAVKDDKDFRALEPAAYLAKGQLKLAGLFLRTLDKNYVLMRLDAEGDHPYEVVYHEYTHLLLSKADWMPLWLNEGLAEFYQTTEIRDKDVAVGEPSTENVLLLRENPMLPMTTLFTVDHTSPFYHEENKGSIFYAQSWAFTHYVLFKDALENTHRLTDYVTLLQQNVDSVTAATRAFGDLKKLQAALEDYVRQSAFHYRKTPAATDIDQSAFQAQALTIEQADAVRADFLAYNERTADAEALLDRILQQDPNNVSAHETKGYLAFRERHLDEAGKYYEQATRLESQNFLAYYYAGAIAMDRKIATDEEPRVEANLRMAIKLNPSFAPTYDRLAALLGMGRRNLDEARMMELNAISIDPANVGYRLNMASILLEMNQGANAIKVLKEAEKVAKTPAEVQAVENQLMNAQAYSSAREERQGRMDTLKGEVSTEEHTVNVNEPMARPDTFVAKGPHRFMTGTITNVHCSMPQLDLTVESGSKRLVLHAENSYKVEFSALGFTPQGDLNPCTDLEGRPAKVEYVESADEAVTPRVLKMELHK